MKNTIFNLVTAFCLLFWPHLKGEDVNTQNKSFKILHLTFHKGCAHEFEKVAKELSLDLTTLIVQDLPPKAFDGITSGNALYNIGHNRAERIWLLHHDYFDTFDAIITSDTAPLARIFLQNGWLKPLIIWICNRFDYSDDATLDCEFPDREFYDLFKMGAQQPNVKIIAYTAFEHYYAKTKNVDTGNLIITPFGSIDTEEQLKASSIPKHIVKKNTFFLPSYHNETLFMNLSAKCNELGIKNYCGRYNGPLDLKEFKGIIHIPYAWSNLALFENIQVGIPYFIPSKAFHKQLAQKNNFFHQNHFLLNYHDLYQLSEWYSPENSGLFTYFDSWMDLKQKIAKANYNELRIKCEALANKKKETMIVRWKEIFEAFENDIK